jgi:hypothetical protein
MTNTAGSPPLGTDADPAATVNSATTTGELGGATASSPAEHGTAPASLGSGPVIGDVNGVGGSASSLGEAVSLAAASRLTEASSDSDATCETNLHRGLETAAVPCSARASVLGLTLGVTGIAVLSLLALALVLSVVGTGALTLERRLQRG